MLFVSVLLKVTFRFRRGRGRCPAEQNWTASKFKR